MPRSYRFLVVLLLIVLWLLVGCAAYTLREAQDSFNKGAEIELLAMDRWWLSEKIDASPVDALAALNSYRLANSVVTKLIDEKSKSLKEDNLLGATYVLKTMALWRISDFEENQVEAYEKPGATAPVRKPTNTRQELLAVLSQIEQLQSKKEITLGTRDRVLYKALYGFYDHNGGLNQSDYTRAREWFQSANKRLKESLSDVPPQHAIRVYIGSARLRTLAAWNKARKSYSVAKEPPSNEDLVMKDNEEIKRIAKEVACELRPFWAKKEEVRVFVGQLLLAIGHPDTMDNCPP